MRLFVVLGLCVFCVCGLPVERQRRGADVDPLTFLSKFGYVRPGALGGSDQRSLEESLKDAVKGFQNSMGLQETGEVDDKTKTAMLAPRCGRPDVGLAKWDKSTISYFIEDGGEDLSKEQARAAIEEALGHWSAVVPLDFVEVDSAEGADFKIGFKKREHGDGDGFDGPGVVLAHAFFPKDGRIHFDDDETWVVKDGDAIRNNNARDLVGVATHEIGHAIGLDHLRGPGHEGDVMYPSWSPDFGPDGAFTTDQLSANDIEAAQELYGKREEGTSGDGGDEGKPQCPEGFTYFSESRKCYKMLSGHGTVEAANKACGEIEDGFTLASIHSDSENNFVVGLNENGATYLGLVSPNKDFKYSWYDGSNLDYTHWLKGEPTTQYGPEYCVVTYGKAYGDINRGWNNAACNIEDYQYVCAGLATSGQDGDEGGAKDGDEKECPEDFTYSPVSDKCYVLISEKEKSIERASEACKSYSPGYNLASISSQEENDWLTGRISSAFFLGYISENNVDFKTFDGSTVGYTNWAAGEPSTEYGIENCIIVFGKSYDEGHKSKWNNVPCEQDYPYLCSGKPLN